MAPRSTSTAASTCEGRHVRKLPDHIPVRSNRLSLRGAPTGRRSNPESHDAVLDCFAPLAMTDQPDSEFTPSGLRFVKQPSPIARVVGGAGYAVVPFFLLPNRGERSAGRRGACEAPWARLRDVPGPLARRSRVPCDRDARLSALHRGDFSPRGRVSVPGIDAVDRAASSSQPARSGRRAGSRGLPGARLRASPAGAAPRSAFKTSPEDAPRRAGMVIGLYS
jgi:hypothetical protein